MTRLFDFNGPSKLGSELTPVQQRKVLSAYVHRYTKEHVPDWARKEWKDGKGYPVQFATDAEWLAHTRFNVSRRGDLAENRDCYTTGQTWPDNPELRKDAS